MGVTGSNGFPCCGKESVEIVEIKSDLPQHQSQPQLIQEEDEMEADLCKFGGGSEQCLQLLPPRLSFETLQLEAELLVPKDDLDSDLDLDVRVNIETDLEPQPEAEPDTTDGESYDEDAEQCNYTIETVNPYAEGPPAHRDFSRWSKKSNSSCLSLAEEDLPAASHCSVCVQTSKHLFRADKLIQASEHSLPQATNMPSSENHPEKLPSSLSKQQSMPTTTLCSEKQLQPSRTQASLPTLSSQPLPSSPCLSSSSLPPAISLAKLINFASSLAMASSSKMDLPSLERMIKAPTQKTPESPTKPVREPVAQPTVKELQQEEPLKVLPERPSEKPPRPEETQNTTGFIDSCLDFTKPGVKRATIEGEVKLLQPQALAPPTQGARTDSVPGPKKGSPLLLKIHFKLSTPSSPEK